MIAWLPEYILFGQPKIVGIWIDDALSVAKARDKHYHTPPGYIVVEPEDTTKRTKNLQQRNCEGYKFQGDAAQLAEAEKLVREWGPDFMNYNITPEFIERIRSLTRQFKYRLDTNFAKMDRIEHEGLEAFKTEILNQEYHGRRIADWATMVSSATDCTGNEEIMKLH
jgi:hypothetical protein